MSYTRILVAVDLTDEAAEVIAAAKQQASFTEDGELHLINVVKPLNLNYGGLDMVTAAPATMNIAQMISDQAKSRIAELAAEAGVSAANVHLEQGHPATEIKSVAEQIGADLIVIGTHGRHGLGLLLGSTANGVLHGVKCDVLTVRIQ